jgi:hypothetical protein
MTTRVFDFQERLPIPAANPPARQSRRSAGFTLCVFAACIAVPVAGASEAPAGWLAASLSAALVLSLAAVFGERLRWGWIVLFAAGVGLGLPRGPWGIVGPPLFVATLLSVIL